MIIFKEQKELKKYLTKLNNNVVGFVPTMGALHQGHISLIKKSAKSCSITICSIYVNPTQFNNTNDLLKYPKTIKDDIQILQENKCDILYCPEDEDLYKENEKPKEYRFNGIELYLEGKYRPCHFNGVATIVEKLLNIINPQKIFLGEKDLQQLMIIKNLVIQKNILTEVIGCPTIREQNGLAKSSRNQHLSKIDREFCGVIYKQLLSSKHLFKKMDLSELKNQIITSITNGNKIKIEYLEFVNLDTFESVEAYHKNIKCAVCIAVSISGVRLIDNIIL
ncbi:pantoate--beta-alanine ligase [Flavobacteriales bacterium]|nr:pantoate--beta-alanine ligase [Flavobacteriales bacterium]